MALEFTCDYTLSITNNSNELVDDGKLFTDFGITPDQFYGNSGQIKKSNYLAKWKLTPEKLYIKVKPLTEDYDSDELFQDVLNDTYLHGSSTSVSYSQYAACILKYGIEGENFTLEELADRLIEIGRVPEDDGDVFIEKFMSSDPDVQDELIEAVFEDQWGDITLELLLDDIDYNN